MKKILTPLILISVFVSCNNSAETIKQNQTLKEDSLIKVIETLKEEKKVVINDINYLRLDYNPYLNMVNEIIIKGSILNDNSITYKNVVLEIIQRSKTKEIIKKEKKTLYEYFNPDKAVEFKFNLGVNKDVEDVQVEIISVKKS